MRNGGASKEVAAADAARRAELLEAVTAEESGGDALPDVAVLEQFAAPGVRRADAWRTMGIVDSRTAFYGSLVAARAYPGSLGESLVQQVFLMSRSVAGAGSIQAKEVAVKSHEPKPGLWERLLTKDGGAPAAQPPAKG